MTEGTTMTAEREAIVRIAKGLTEAQRRWIFDSGKIATDVWKGHEMSKKGICTAMGWPIKLTPLGLAVRDHLKESTHE